MLYKHSNNNNSDLSRTHTWNRNGPGVSLYLLHEDTGHP